MSKIQETIDYVKEDGEFSDCKEQVELASEADIEYTALVASLKIAHARIAKLENAIKWALGEKGDFPQRQDGQGSYYWRTELRKRAFSSKAKS